jgi:ferritin-like protein
MAAEQNLYTYIILRYEFFGEAGQKYTKFIEYSHVQSGGHFEVL